MIQRNILLNLIKEKISDVYFINLLSQMFIKNILCPEGFIIKKSICCLEKLTIITYTM